ncbi:putative tetratricopeptide-like helical domain superfamily, DYW domain-containing protein [Dioscorea sansibarensis]
MYIPAFVSSLANKRHTTFYLNSTIRAHLRSGHPSKALSHFLKSLKHGINPDNFTIPSLLKLSLDLHQPSLHGEQVHALTIKSGYTDDLVVTTGLVEFYCKHGLCDSACQVFTEMPYRDVVLFTAMVSGLSQNGLACEALDFFSKMLDEGYSPNKLTISSVLCVCSKISDHALGRVLHGFTLRGGLLDETDIVMGTALLDMYAKCGKLSYAMRVFNCMTERNNASWNAIITGFALNGSFHVALELFKGVILENHLQPRSDTLVVILNVCGATMDLRKGKELHAYILKLLRSKTDDEKSIALCNSIMNMYIKVGNFDSAIVFFETMKKRDLITWTMIISGYGSYGFSRRALHAFREMESSGIQPDRVAFLSLLSACSHGGMVEQGTKLFTSMQEDYGIVPGMEHYACMVDIYGRAGRLEEAYEFISQIPLVPSSFIWAALLSSCRNHKNVKLGVFAAKNAIELDPYNVGNYVMLSRLYTDACRWEDVAKVRSIMKELRLKPDTACSWVQVKGRVYEFSVADYSRENSKEIYVHLKTMIGKMKIAGFVPDTSSVGHKIKEEDKVNDLCGHTEKLALAFALMNCGGDGLVRIGKNLRVCRDCHNFFKLLVILETGRSISYCFLCTLQNQLCYIM